MRTLSIDIETYSPISLAKAGVYKYCNHPDFQILLFSYAIDSCTVRTVDLASGEQLPAKILRALDDLSLIHI